MNFVLSKLKELINNANILGLPIPSARDPKTGKGSVSLTFLWISGIIVAAGLIGRITNIIGNVDLVNALWFYGVSASLYYGRKIQGSGKDLIIEEKEKTNE